MEKIVIGIDISAKTLDICIKKCGSYSFYVIANEAKAIKVFFKIFQKSKSEIMVSE